MSADQIRAFKEFELSYSDNRGEYSHGLASVLSDKGISGEAAAALSEGDVAGRLLARQLIGDFDIHRDTTPSDVASVRMNLAAVRASSLVSRMTPTYTGTIHENRIISEDPYTSGVSNQHLRVFRRNGASREFRTGLFNVGGSPDSLHLPLVPIAVVGGGAAGILTARALLESGFTSVDVYDRRGEVGGIWTQDNVRGGTKNNPFEIVYDHHRVGSAARENDLRQSGLHIGRFINDIAISSTNPNGRRVNSGQLNVRQGIIREIEPGDLEHRLLISESGTNVSRTYPIVVYAPGIGEPMPLSHEGHMTTTATRREAGVRWQQQLSSERLRELSGKRLVFVGLGNSTAEMVHQLQEYEDRTGRRIDYRIVTHYPIQTLREPERPAIGQPALYRNIGKPELTKLAGDLHHIDLMYQRSFDEGKIIGGVKEWHVDNGTFVTVDHDGVRTSVPYDQVYTLTGYRQSPESLDRVGITVLDEYTTAGAFDYDGEVQSKPGVEGRSRLYPGYFAIGPILKNRHNPNAVVIPGIQGQLNNLLPSLVLRATEYALGHSKELEVIQAERASRVLNDSRRYSTNAS